MSFAAVSSLTSPITQFIYAAAVIFKSAMQWVPCTLSTHLCCCPSMHLLAGCTIVHIHTKLNIILTHTQTHFHLWFCLRANTFLCRKIAYFHSHQLTRELFLYVKRERERSMVGRIAKQSTLKSVESTNTRIQTPKMVGFGIRKRTEEHEIKMAIHGMDDSHHEIQRQTNGLANFSHTPSVCECLFFIV